MSFLVPLFLLGAAAIAGPIVAHLIRRATRDRVEFSDTRFLDPSAPRLSRRSRLEHPWLLALRCLAVLVLSAGFARPFFKRESPLPPLNDAPQDVVVVLDESASMQRTGLWTAAVDRVRGAAAALGPNDRFALLACGASVTMLLDSSRWAATPPEQRRQLLTTIVTSRSPGWGTSHLDTGVDAALDELATMAETGEGAAPRTIVIVSDFTAGVRVSGLAGRDWPADCEVVLERISPPPHPNASLQWLGWNAAADGARTARVRLAHDGAQPAPLRLQVRDAATGNAVGETQLLTLAPHEARVVSLPVPAEAGAPLRIDIAGDGERFDNTVWAVSPQPREVAVAFLGSSPAADDPQQSLFYLSRALTGWRDPVVQLTPLRATSAAPLPEARVFVIAAPLDAALIASVRERLAAGAFALVLLDDAALAPTAAELAGESGWTVASATQGDALLGTIDFRHPLFAPFADPRFSDFTHVRFWRPAAIALPAATQAAVAARFDDGSAAVLEAPVGRGRLVVWGGDWTPAASQWVLSTKFVPWLQSLVQRASGGPPRPNVAEVGDARRLTSASQTRWRPITAGPNAFTDEIPGSPGAYEIAEEDGRRWVALQVPAIESRTDPLPLDTWEQLGVPLEAAPKTESARTAARAAAASSAALEHEQQLWRWLLLAAVVILAVESAAAIRVARRQLHPTSST